MAKHDTVNNGAHTALCTNYLPTLISSRSDHCVPHASIIFRQRTASRGNVQASTAALHAQLPHRQPGAWNLLHEEQSAHGQPAACPRMVHAKQEQPFFTALVDRWTTPVIAPAVRTLCREDCTEDRTSACSEGDEG